MGRRSGRACLAAAACSMLLHPAAGSTAGAHAGWGQMHAQAWPCRVLLVLAPASKNEGFPRLSLFRLACRRRGSDDVRWAEGGGSSYKVEPEVVAELYRRWVMPLTKEVQIQYLLRRLDDEAYLPPENE